jgi:hypothetical protein
VGAYLYNVGVLISQIICCLLYGQNPDKSLSQLHGQVAIEGHTKKWWTYLIPWWNPWVMEAVRRIINFIFAWEETKVGHCEDSYLDKYERGTKDCVLLARGGNLE